MTARPSDADFIAIDVSTPDAGDWAQEFLRIIHDTGAISRAMVTTGTSPDHHLTSLEMGDAGSHNDIRLHYDGTFFKIQQNTGSEGTPSWIDRFTVNATTAAAAVLALSATSLNLNGGTIINAGTINAVSMTAHASRHQPGGADAIPVAVVSDIASANAEGASTSLARADHAHRGIASLRKAGGTLLYGAVTLSEGAGIDIARVGQDLEIARATETYDDNSAQADQTGIVGTETAIIWDNPDTGNGILFPGADGVKNFYVQPTLGAFSVANVLEVDWRLRVGPLGTIADAETFRSPWEAGGAGQQHPGAFLVKVLAPSNTDVATISAQRTAGTGNLTVVGGATTANKYCTIRIWPAP